MKKVCLILAMVAWAMTLLTGCEKKTPQVGLSGYHAVIIVVNNCRWDVMVSVEDKTTRHLQFNVPAHSSSEPQDIMNYDTQDIFNDDVKVYIRMRDMEQVTDETIYAESVFFAEGMTHTFTINEDYSVNYESSRY